MFPSPAWNARSGGRSDGHGLGAPRAPGLLWDANTVGLMHVEDVEGGLAEDLLRIPDTRHAVEHGLDRAWPGAACWACSTASPMWKQIGRADASSAAHSGSCAGSL